jgi:hypothetical protein
MLVTDSRGIAARWMQETGWARAVYDVIAAVVAGTDAEESRVGKAAQAPIAIWERVLALESCGAWLDNARRQSATAAAALTPAESLLRASSAQSLRSAITAMRQVAEIAEVAAGSAVRVLALKGMARLLAGEPAGTRSMSDIDLLVPDDAAPALHAALQSRLGYQPDVPGTPTRHLPSLTRAGSMTVEIHHRLTDSGSPVLEHRVWLKARPIPVGIGSIEIPDGTALLMHTLEHAIVVHRTARFRLRDVLDVSTLATEATHWREIDAYVAAHRDRSALRTLLAAAGRMAGQEASDRGSWDNAADRSRAWRKIRRVGRTRLLAPARADIPPASDPRVMVLSQLAQGSPRGILRLAVRAIAMPARAAQLMSGAWLPVEAERARAEPDAPAPPTSRS